MACRGTAPAQGSGSVLGLMSCAHVKPEHLQRHVVRAAGQAQQPPAPTNPQLNTINYS